MCIILSLGIEKGLTVIPLVNDPGPDTSDESWSIILWSSDGIVLLLCLWTRYFI